MSMICIGVSFAIDPWCESFVAHLLLSFLAGVGIALFIGPAMTAAVKNISDGTNTPIIFAYEFFISATGRLISGILTGMYYNKSIIIKKWSVD